MNLGILISDSTEGVVPHKRVELDARAAYEILLYYTQAYFSKPAVGGEDA